MIDLLPTPSPNNQQQEQQPQQSLARHHQQPDFVANNSSLNKIPSSPSQSKPEPAEWSSCSSSSAAQLFCSAAAEPAKFSSSQPAAELCSSSTSVQFYCSRPAEPCSSSTSRWPVRLFSWTTTTAATLFGYERNSVIIRTSAISFSWPIANTFE